MIIFPTYKAMNDEAPSYISNLLELHAPIRDIRSSIQNVLVIPRVHIKYGEKAFSYCAPKLWNDLPLYMKLSSTLTLVTAFKTALKTYLFDVAYAN